MSCCSSPTPDTDVADPDDVCAVMVSASTLDYYDTCINQELERHAVNVGLAAIG